jgi:alkanesulfonate monooxygenase SsuD/methylene tetrahydromethanopterin reductase-like flavin-dependent oxidoreductase (luciferase family)
VVGAANIGYEKALACAAGLRSRPARYGRPADAVRILPGAVVVVGDTAKDAEDKAGWLSEEQVSPPRAIAFLEQYWGTDLSAWDPEGPLPDIEPSEGELAPLPGHDRHRGPHREAGPDRRQASPPARKSVAPHSRVPLPCSHPQPPCQGRAVVHQVRPPER